MWPYIKLFYTGNYWRLVRRRHFWVESWRALRRAHKDSRARKQLKLLTTVLITPPIALGYTGLALSALVGLALAVAGGKDVGNHITSGVVWFGFVGIAVWRIWHSRKASGEQLLDPDWTVTADVRRKVAELTLLYAVLTDRAGSEAFLAAKTLPEELEVTTRRNHVALLREYGLWDRLASEEKELLMRPDGHWEAGVSNQVALLLEPLKVLRWTLRLDQFLPVVGQGIRLDYALARETLSAPAKIFAGTEVVTRKGLVTARDAANHYFQRCAAEGVKRGYFPAESEKNEAWSKEYSDKMAGRQSEDLLLGSRIVSEADENTVRLATTLAVRRLRMCNWLLKVLEGELELGPEWRFFA